MIRSIKAFTLAETLIAMGILSLITGAVMSVLMVGLSSWQIGEAKTQGQQDARRAMQLMTRELRLGNPGHIEILNESGSLIKGSGVKIRFQVPQIIDSLKKWGATTADGAQFYENYWVYYELIKESGENTGQLKRTVLASNKTSEISGTSTILANNVESINFIGLPDNTYSPMSIQIILATTNVGNTKDVKSSLKSRVWLRNLS